MASTTTSLPLAPLLSYAQRAAAPEGGTAAPISDKEFARMIGVSSRTVARWRADADCPDVVGYVPWPSCDDCATALGSHPALIWGELWSDMDDAMLRAYEKHPDQRTVAEKRVIRQIERAMERIGEVMAQEAKGASVAA